jgi:hypothetical protein
LYAPLPPLPPLPLPSVAAADGRYPHLCRLADAAVLAAARERRGKDDDEVEGVGVDGGESVGEAEEGEMASGGDGKTFVLSSPFKKCASLLKGAGMLQNIRKHGKQMM